MKRTLFNATVFMILFELFGPAASQGLHGQSSEARTVSEQEIRPLARVYPTMIPSSEAWLGADKSPLPFKNDAEVMEFLKTAEVISSEGVKEGITGIQKVLLERDGFRAHAAFQDVEIKKRSLRMIDGTTRLNFRDDWRFDLAAYRLSRLLGLDNVPPVVERKINGERGKLQIWVENCMMEKDRAKNKIEAPNRLTWLYQWQIVHLFDNLIYNDDRNQGNILIDPNWRVWMIDHTRAFLRNKELKNPQVIHYCSRTLWEALPKLTKTLLERELGDLLANPEIEALLVRRDLLIEHIQGLIDKKGKGAVLF